MSCEERVEMIDTCRGSIEEDVPAGLLSSMGHVDSAATGVMGQRSRWSKLRGTIQVANAASLSVATTRHHHQLNREDSFLKKFSTRQSAAPYFQADAADRATAEVLTAAGDESDLDPDQGHIDPEVGQTSSVRRPQWRKMMVINPDESAMFYWLTLTASAVLYNLWTWPNSSVFTKITAKSL